MKRNVKEDLNTIHTYVKGKYGYRRNIDIEELISEANFQFATILNEYKGQANNFIGYSIRRIDLRLVDFLRSHGPVNRDGKKRVTPTLFCDYKDGGKSVMDTLATYDSIYDEESDKKDVEGLLEVLTDEEKRIIKEMYYGDKSIYKVAKEDGVSYSKVRNIHNRALSKMRGENEDLQQETSIRFSNE